MWFEPAPSFASSLILSPSLNPSSTKSILVEQVIVELAKVKLPTTDVPSTSAAIVRVMFEAFACILSLYPVTFNSLFALYI